MELTVPLIHLWLHFAKEKVINDRRAPRKRSIRAVSEVMAAFCGVDLDTSGELHLEYIRDCLQQSLVLMSVETEPGLLMLDIVVLSAHFSPLCSARLMVLSPVCYRRCSLSSGSSPAQPWTLRPTCRI